MSETRCESLFFTSLPDLRRLCAVKVTLNPKIEKSGLRDAQIKLCRYLLFQYQDVVASPAPEELNQILLITAIPFYKAGQVQVAVEKYEAKMETPLRVIPALLQTCLSYTLTARLAPSWNKAGHLLIQGKDFLSQKGKQNAVVMDLYVSETQLCISLKVYTVRLPPPELGEFDISTRTIMIFGSNKHAVIPRDAISSNWCYVLPSMKMGQIISVHHTIPPDSPFLSYEDLQVHWNNLYGYRLPENQGEDLVYCSVYFKLIGERLFTYPFSCLRSQPVQFFPRADLEGVLKTFISDLKSNLPHLCGFPVRMTSKPCYPTKELSISNMQQIQSRPVNLSGKSILRPSLTQAPANKSTTLQVSVASRTAYNHKMEPFSSQPTTCIFTDLSPASEEAIAAPVSVKSMHLLNSGVLGEHGHSSQFQSSSQSKDIARIIPIFKSRLLQMSQKDMKTSDRRKKQSSSQNTLSISQKENTVPKAAVFKPGVSQTNASDMNTSVKRTSSDNMLTMLNGKSTMKTFRPTFSQKNEPSTHVDNPACIHGVSFLKNANEVNRKSKPFLSASPKAMFQTSATHEGMLKPASLSFHHKKKDCVSNPKSAHILETNHMVRSMARPPKLDLDTEMSTPYVPQHLNETLNEGAALKMGINLLAPALNSDARKPDVRASNHLPLKLREEFSTMAPDLCLQFNPCQEQEEVFGVKHKKSKPKPSVQDADVEQHARNNQLSKLNSATLQSWLKQRGVSVKTRDKKEELVSKIMKFVSEP